MIRATLALALMVLVATAFELGTAFRLTEAPAAGICACHD